MPVSTRQALLQALSAAGGEYVSGQQLAEKLGVSRAQAMAMVAGSMFGWQTQAADPCSYDEQGRMTAPKQRSQKERGRSPVKNENRR